MLRLSALVALAAALSLPSLAQAQSAPAQAAGVQAADTAKGARYATLAEAVAATVTQEAKLTANDGGLGEQFGLSVSLSGDRALVGAPGDQFLDNFSGAAYVFAFDGAAWSQEAKLVASDAAALDEFGTSVSLDGDRALIGASFDDNAAGTNAGAAYVFAFDGAAWSQQTKLAASDASPFDRFGTSVSLSGDRALIGTPFNINAAGFQAGSAYVFAFDGAAWSQEAELNAGDAAAGDRFGASVSLSGGRALIGAQRDNATGWGSFEGPGAAYVFAFDGAAWSQQAKLAASDASPFDQFGRSVSLSGDRAFIGAWADDDGGSDSGSAYVFAFDGAAWGQEAKLTASDAVANDRFGWSVSLDGDRALVGALRKDDAGGSGPFLSGAAYVFAFEGASWSQEAKLTASDAATGDQFGVSVSLDGGRALVGAWQAGAGAAYVFSLGAPLVADAGPNQTVIAGQTVTLDGTGSVGAQTFAWTLAGGPTLSGATTATPSFCASAPGTYIATLTVTGDGGSDTDAATVTAQSPSAALVAIAGGVSAATALNQAQKAALVAELKKAQRALARGLSPTPFLNAFRSQVQGLQAQGVLTAGQAGALIGLVDAVDAAVASPCSQTGAPSTASATAAEGFGLSVWPNPSAGRTTVAFSVEAAGAVRLSVHDALGREVAVLAEGAVEAGRHEAVLDAEALPAGVYLVRLATADGRVATERLTRLR